MSMITIQGRPAIRRSSESLIRTELPPIIRRRCSSRTPCRRRRSVPLPVWTRSLRGCRSSFPTSPILPTLTWRRCVTYKYSINGQDFVASSSPGFLLPDYTPGAVYQLRGYVEDHDGATSPIYTATVIVAAADVVVGNFGTGSVRLTWAGAPEPVELGPNQTYDFGGVTSADWV